MAWKVPAHTLRDTPAHVCHGDVSSYNWTTHVVASALIIAEALMVTENPASGIAVLSHQHAYLRLKVRHDTLCENLPTRKALIMTPWNVSLAAEVRRRQTSVFGS